ncbi:hypothetical protein [Pararhizobium qamdonense]|uniref:hypothetical protein n=1 Tax=Pararhizobium qamdonense TaxID=3031126 RepID=UPI0023E0BA4A|nr:hypothetical protein [Pararhizobium qamdonense]
MNKREYLLTKLIEECLEVAQRATKAQTFGINEVEPGQKLDNTERLNLEWNDLLATVELLHEEEGISLFGDSELIRRKKQKILQFMNYSREQGCLA